MNLHFAIIPSQLKLLLRAQVLVAEEHDTPLSDQQGELVSLLVSEIFELETNDLGADVRCQVLDFLRSREQGSLLGVGASAGIDVFAVVVADGVDVLEVEGAGGPVLPKVNAGMINVGKPVRTG